MAGVELLVARAHIGAEAGDIGARILEIVEGLQQLVVGVIVVEAEILVVIDVVIESEGELILIVGAGGDGLVSNAVRPVRRRYQAEHINRNGIHALRRNRGIATYGRKYLIPQDARRRRLPAQRGNGWGAARPAVQRIGYELIASAVGCEAVRPSSWKTAGEDTALLRGTGPLRRGGHYHSLARDPLAYTAAFIRDKEECPVLPERTAESPTELVLVELRLDRVEVPLRVEHFVAEILIHVAVPPVGARLGDDVDDSAGVASVLRVEGIADHAKFFDGVRRGLNGGQVDELVVGVAAVDTEIIGAITATVDGNGSGAVDAIKRSAAGAQLRLHSGLQLQELIAVAGVEREFVHRPIIDDSTQLSAAGVDQRGLGCDVNDFLSASELHGHIESDDLVDVEGAALANALLKNS